MFFNDLKLGGSPESNSLLQPEQNQTRLALQRLYYSRSCQYFYIFLMFLTTLMIMLTLVLGKETLDSKPMLILDLFLTATIVLDVAFRIKMMGARQYFSFKWNIFEAGISLCCVLTFVLLILRKFDSD